MSSLVDRIDAPCQAAPTDRKADSHFAEPYPTSGKGARARAPSLANGSLEVNTLGFIPRRVTAGSDIVSEGTAAPQCIIVRQGWVAPYKLLPDGRRQLLDLLLEHDGIQICRDNRDCASHSVVALTDAYVLQGNAEDLAQAGALRRGSELCTAPLFAEQQRRMMDRMAILGHGRAAERLASCLLDLWRRQHARGHVDETGACPIPIRQSDLGDAVGLTSVHVCRTLTIFRRLGLLEFANGRLRMLCPDKVAIIAGCECERTACDM